MVAKTRFTADEGYTGLIIPIDAEKTQQNRF